MPDEIPGVDDRCLELATRFLENHYARTGTNWRESDCINLARALQQTIDDFIQEFQPPWQQP